MVHLCLEYTQYKKKNRVLQIFREISSIHNFLNTNLQIFFSSTFFSRKRKQISYWSKKAFSLQVEKHQVMFGEKLVEIRDFYWLLDVLSKISVQMLSKLILLILIMWCFGTKYNHLICIKYTTIFYALLSFPLKMHSRKEGRYKHFSPFSTVYIL